eukprot:g3347.t1
MSEQVLSGSSLLSKYKAWLGSGENYALAKQAEDMLRMATLLFLPVSDPTQTQAHVFSETAFALVNTLGMVNDQVYASTRNTSPVVAERTRWALTALGNLAVIGEILSSRSGGDSGRWNMILGVETVRAMLRLRILSKNGWRTLERGGDIAPPQNPSSSNASIPSKQPNWWRGTNGTMLPIPSSIRTESTVRAPNLPRGNTHKLAEVLSISRPIVYAFLRSVLGKKSWLPLLAALAVALVSDRLCRAAQDAANRSCRRAGLRGAACSTPENLKQETYRRRLALLSYLMRAPLFEKITRRVFEAVYYGFSYIPLVRVFVRYVIDMIYYVQRYYFFSSA